MDVSWPNRNLGPGETLSPSSLLSSTFPSFTDEETDQERTITTLKSPSQNLGVISNRLDSHFRVCGSSTQDRSPGAEDQALATVDKKPAQDLRIQGQIPASSITYPTLVTGSLDGWIMNLIWIWGGDRRAIF